MNKKSSLLIYPSILKVTELDDIPNLKKQTWKEFINGGYQMLSEIQILFAFPESLGTPLDNYKMQAALSQWLRREIIALFFIPTDSYKFEVDKFEIPGKDEHYNTHTLPRQRWGTFISAVGGCQFRAEKHLLPKDPLTYRTSSESLRSFINRHQPDYGIEYYGDLPMEPLVSWAGQNPCAGAIANKNGKIIYLPFNDSKITKMDIENCIAIQKNLKDIKPAKTPAENRNKESLIPESYHDLEENCLYFIYSTYKEPGFFQWNNRTSRLSKKPSMFAFLLVGKSEEQKHCSYDDILKECYKEDYTQYKRTIKEDKNKEEIIRITGKIRKLTQAVNHALEEVGISNRLEPMYHKELLSRGYKLPLSLKPSLKQNK